jgi:predicted transcriptional regulator
MLSYIDVLSTESQRASVRLIDAFTHAGIPTSTFYRAKNGVDLRYSTATKVFKAIGELSTLQRADRSN